ncbi:MAG: ABC transporter substrate-binding protein, partial [Bacillus sp. (in: firmicutes)]
MASKSKRYFLLSTCLLLALMMFTSACGNKADESAQSNGTEKKEVTLKYYNWDNEAQQEGTDAMLREFEAANPGIKVEHVVLVPGNSLEMLKKLDFLISSGDEVDVV